MFHHVVYSRERVKNQVSEDTEGGQPYIVLSAYLHYGFQVFVPT